MNKKIIIILTIFATSLILIGGYLIYQYEIDRNEISYNEGYSNGLLYTQQTGNIIFSNNGTLKEMQVAELCSILIQQELNQQGGV